MPRSSRSDIRLRVLVLMLLVVIGFGFFVQLFPGRGVETDISPIDAGRAAFSGLKDASNPPAVPAEVTEETQGKLSAPDAKELNDALKKAAALVAAKRYDEAIATLNRVRPLAGSSAKAYLQLGRALQGKGDHATARDFLTKAIDLDPTLAEAYFDHATASEALGDLESALGGMRSFIHVAKDADPYRLPIAQARSAIWEWEAKLGRGPYGPTKGIPPGFTAEQIKRDGKGVGTMMQKPETLRPDGTMDYEIKSGERFPNLWKK